jgi:hypothetical protein
MAGSMFLLSDPTMLSGKPTRPGQEASLSDWTHNIEPRSTHASSKILPKQLYCVDYIQKKDPTPTPDITSQRQ